MVFRRLALGVCAGTLLLGMLAGHSQANGWLRDVDHALSVASVQKRPMVLFVSMDGCLHCYRMIDTTFRDAGVRQILGKSFVAAAIKGSERPDLMKQLQIDNYPTTLLVGPDGEVLDQMVGYVGAEKFYERLQNLTAQSTADAGARFLRTSRYTAHKKSTR